MATNTHSVEGVLPTMGLGLVPVGVDAFPLIRA